MYSGLNIQSPEWTETGLTHILSWPLGHIKEEGGDKAGEDGEEKTDADDD